MFSPRIGLKPLTQLCHRLAVATEAGIKDVKTWKSEADRGSSAQRRQIDVVCKTIDRGGSISDAVEATGNFFPPLFRQMVQVGDVTGQMGRTYKRLAEHYDRALVSRRSFRVLMAWPLLQLGMALAVVGILILVMGILPSSTPGGEPTDILGFGLVGMRGFILYLNLLIVIAIALLLLALAVRRGALWTRGLQRLVVKIPMIGAALKTLALARITWSLALLLDTSLDVRRALLMALDSCGNDYFARHSHDVVRSIEGGQSIHGALSATQVFPTDLLDNIAVGEQSGKLVETMRVQSVEYERRAAAALAILAHAAGVGVWLAIAALIITLIFRLFGFYTQQIYNAINM